MLKKLTINNRNFLANIVDNQLKSKTDGDSVKKTKYMNNHDRLPTFYYYKR